VLHLPFDLILGALFLVVGNGVVWFDERARKDAVKFQHDVFVAQEPKAIERYREIKARHPDYIIQVLKTDVFVSLVAVNLIVIMFMVTVHQLVPIYKP
jgi:hypothetical protein